MSQLQDRIFDWLGKHEGPAPLPKEPSMAAAIMSDATGTIYASWRAIYFNILELRHE